MANRSEINKDVCAILRLINIFLKHLERPSELLETRENIMLVLEDEVSVNYNLRNGSLEYLNLKEGKIKTDSSMCGANFSSDKFRKEMYKLFSKRVKGGLYYHNDDLLEERLKFNPQIKYIDKLVPEEVYNLLKGNEDGIGNYYPLENYNRLNKCLYYPFGTETKVFNENYKYFIDKIKCSERNTYLNSPHKIEWIERIFEIYYKQAGMDLLWESWKIYKKYLEENPNIEGRIFFNTLYVETFRIPNPLIRDTFVNNIELRMPLDSEIEHIDPTHVYFCGEDHSYRWFKW